MTADSHKRQLMGVEVTALTLAELNRFVAEAALAGGRVIVANHNLHSVYLASKDAQLRNFFASSDVVHVDGMALIGIGRLLGLDLRREHRTTYVDWTGPLMEMAAHKGLRVFYLGGAPAVAECAAEKLRATHPALKLATADGYFDERIASTENKQRLTQIRQFAPHILMVGMSMPRQEHWIRENLENIPNCVILTCGAAFDYVAGAVPTPSRTASRLGLEWLWRLAAEPRRLWKRYLVEPWFLLALFGKDLWRYRIARSSVRS